MNIQEALDMADAMKPNMMPRTIKIGFLQDLDQKIYSELLMKHKHEEAQEVKPEYNADTDAGKELLAPDPYARELYMYWLMSQIDMQNREFENFNNDRAMFDNQYEQLSDWWTREHMPLTAMPFVRI